MSIAEEILEPYIDEDQLLDLASYKDELIGWMLSETENGKEPVEFYHQLYVDSVISVGDLAADLPFLGHKKGKAGAKLEKGILECLQIVINFALLYGHAFDIQLPDVDILEFEMSSALPELQASPTMSAMGFLDPLSALSYEFFINRQNQDDEDKDEAELMVNAMLAGVCNICKSMDKTLIDLMYAND
jgi:hypothetical protein